MKKEKKEKQLEFGLKGTPKNIYYKYKKQYELWLAGLETKKFIKDPLTWLTIILSISLVGTQIYMIESKDKIPQKVPIFNYFLNPTKKLVHDEYLYLLPLLSILILLVTIILSNRYYHKERDLSKIIIIVALLVNTSLCLTFIKLFLSF